MTLRSWGRFALVVAVAIVVQVSVLDEIVIHNAHPDVLLLVAIAAGLAGGPQEGAVAAFALGLVADLFVDTPYGVSALTFVLVAFVVGVATSAPNERLGPGIRFTTAVLASAAGTLLFAGIGYLLGQPLILRANIVAVVAVVTVGNAILALPVTAAVQWAMKATPHDNAERSLAGARSR